MFGSTFFLSLLRSYATLVGFAILFLLLDKPRFSWKKTVVGYSLFTAVCIICLGALRLMDSDSLEKYVVPAILVLTVSFVSWMSRVVFFQMFYNLSFQTFILIFHITCACLLTQTFFDGNLWTEILFRLAFLALTVWIYRCWFCKVLRVIVDSGCTKWICVSVASMVGNLLLVYYVVSPRSLAIRTGNGKLIFFCLWGLMLTIHLMMLRMWQSIEREMRTKKEDEFLNLNNCLLQRQLDVMQKSVEEAHHLRHDLRHHDLAIVEYVRNGETKELLNYMNQQGQTTKTPVPIKVCSHVAANNIISAYAHKAAQNHIAFHLNVQLEKDIPIRDTDMVTILANIMENAILGSIHANVVNPKIELFIRRKSDKLVIECHNTCCMDIRFEEGIPHSNSGSGLGVSSILRAAAQYGGETDFRNEEGIFICRMLLNIPTAH